MVVPVCLSDRLHGLLDNHAPFVSFITQKALEGFMKEGHYESQLRKARKTLRAKRDALIGALAAGFGEDLDIFGAEAGSRLLAHAKWPAIEGELVSRALAVGVGVSPISRYWLNLGDGKGCEGTVMLDYGGISFGDIEGAVSLLRGAWRRA
jgi:GntR family transcriptional regulator/MocR family aminotransferase